MEKTPFNSQPFLALQMTPRCHKKLSQVKKPLGLYPSSRVFWCSFKRNASSKQNPPRHQKWYPRFIWDFYPKSSIPKSFCSRYVLMIGEPFAESRAALATWVGNVAWPPWAGSPYGANGSREAVPAADHSTCKGGIPGMWDGGVEGII